MRQLSTSLKLILLLAGFVLVVTSAQWLLSNVRIDLTEDKLYTLNDGTRKILANLKEPVRLRLTYSEKTAAGYPQIQSYAQQVNDMLDAFARVSKGKVTIERITPQPFSEAEDIAVQAGLRGAPTANGETLYFGLEATNSTSGRAVIPFFSPEREPQLEYDLIRIVSQLNQPQKPKIGLLTSLPLPFGPGGPIAMVQGNSRPYALFVQMREQYQLSFINPEFTDIPDDVNLLVVAHPAPMTEAQLFALDQFVMRGGRLMLFIDPVSEMALTLQGSNAMLAGSTPPPLASDLQPLLSAWGVTLAPGQVAADGKFAQQVSIENGQPLYYLPWIGVHADVFAKDNLTVQGLRQINLATSGILQLQPRDGLKQEPLYTTSDVAGVFDATVFRDNPDPAELIETFKPTGAQYVLAVQLSGIFPSSFSQSPVAGKPFLAKSKMPTSVLVVADSDMLSDALWVQVGGTQDTPIYEPIADNGSFFFNSADLMLGSTELLSLRSRRPAARPFTLVQEKQIEAERDLRARQAELMEELTTTQNRITQMEGSGGTGEKFLSKAQKAEIEKFRQKVTQTRKSLREIQGRLRQSVSALKTRITLANVAIIPGLLLLVALIRGFRRSRRVA